MKCCVLFKFSGSVLFLLLFVLLFELVSSIFWLAHFLAFVMCRSNLIIAFMESLPHIRKTSLTEVELFLSIDHQRLNMVKGY